jgi:hypothetical protein
MTARRGALIAGVVLAFSLSYVWDHAPAEGRMTIAVLSTIVSAGAFIIAAIFWLEKP